MRSSIFEIFMRSESQRQQIEEMRKSINYPMKDVFRRYAERDFVKKARNCVNEKQYSKLKAEYIIKQRLISI